MSATELFSWSKVVLLSFFGGDIHYSREVHEDTLRALIVVQTTEFFGRVYDTIILAFEAFSQFEEDDGTFLYQRVDDESAPDYDEDGAER